MASTISVWRSDSPAYRLVRGPIRRWLVDHHIPGLYTPRLRGYQVRAERIPDMVAMAEADGFRVVIQEREARP